MWQSEVERQISLPVVVVKEVLSNRLLCRLKNVHFHDLRKTFATGCVFRGVPAKTLQKWMGHKSIKTTMKYYVVSPEEFEEEAIKRLDGMCDT